MLLPKDATFHLSTKGWQHVFDRYKIINVDNVASLTILSMLTKLANYIISNISYLVKLAKILLFEELVRI